MPTLDYAQSRPSRLRHVVYGITAVFLLIALIAIRWQAPTWYQRWQGARLANAYRLIDAEIPGTEVYFGDKLLGTTPLILSKAECAAAGLPVAPGTLVKHGLEGLWFHDPTTNSEPRVMYKVPSSRASSFQTYETPWGLRTKMAGGWDLPNGFRAKFMSHGVGVIVNIDFNAKPAASEKLLKLNVSVTSNGISAYTGFRPEVVLYGRAFDDQRQDRFHQTFTLPSEWANIAPGQTLKTTVEIPLPAAAGDYSVFANFHLFKDETGDHLVGQDSGYSDSKLLHVP